MYYVKFSTKDTDAIIKSLTKVIECDPSKSMKVKSISFTYKQICSEIRTELRIYGYMQYRLDYLKYVHETVSLFGSFFNFSTTDHIQNAIRHYSSYISGHKSISLRTSNGDFLIYAED